MIKEKDIVEFGQIANIPIKWQVLQIDKSNALLASCSGIGTLPYDENGGMTSWPDCSLRRWLNNTFFKEAFSEEERNQINSVYLPDALFHYI